MNVKRFAFFLGEFFFNGCCIESDWTVIVVLVTCSHFGRVTGELACKGNALGEDAESSMKVRWRLAWEWGSRSALMDTLKSLLPLSMAVCVFAAQPPLEISVLEIKTQ